MNILVPGITVFNKSEKTENIVIKTPPRIVAVGIYFSKIFNTESLFFNP